MYLKFDLTRPQRLDYKAKLVEFAKRQSYSFHVTASLNSDGSIAKLEDCLRGWVARVDRYYLGRSWLRRPEHRMQGVVFFEQGPVRTQNHAHLLVSPPAGAPEQDFALRVPSWWSAVETDAMPIVIRPVTRYGQMYVQQVHTPADLKRVAGYDMKDFERGCQAIEKWKFLADLSSTPG